VEAEVEESEAEVEEEASGPEPEAPVEEEAAETEVPEVEIEEETPEPEPEPPAEEEAEETETEEPEVEVEEEAPPPGPETPAVEAETEEVAVPAKPDDLKRIEGIGPKIAGVLQAGGILTYAQLADSDPEQLRQILEASDPRLIRIANPDTWPDQAKLAAAGDWEGFETLNRELKGGRRA
jgi:predicted flap endonuclease-1-like 5' DNA nuclease